MWKREQKEPQLGNVMRMIFSAGRTIIGVGLAKLDPNIPQGLEFFSQLESVILRPFMGEIQIPIPPDLLGQKYQVVDNTKQTLFYAIRSKFTFDLAWTQMILIDLIIDLLFKHW